MLPYGLDSNVTKLRANLLTKRSLFYYFVNCILKSSLNKNYFCYDYNYTVINGICVEGLNKLLLLSLLKRSAVQGWERVLYPWGPCVWGWGPKTPAPQYQPIDREKRKGKRVEDYSRDRAAGANKEALALLL